MSWRSSSRSALDWETQVFGDDGRFRKRELDGAYSMLYSATIEISRKYHKFEGNFKNRVDRIITETWCSVRISLIVEIIEVSSKSEQQPHEMVGKDVHEQFVNYSGGSINKLNDRLFECSKWWNQDRHQRLSMHAHPHYTQGLCVLF